MHRPRASSSPPGCGHSAQSWKQATGVTADMGAGCERDPPHTHRVLDPTAVSCCRHPFGSDRPMTDTQC